MQKIKYIQTAKKYLQTTFPKKGLVSRIYKELSGAPAGVAQWIECQPANQGVAGSILGQGTCLGY